MTTIYLFDPRLNVQEETTVEKVIGFSGLTRKTILYASRKQRRISATGCYLSRTPFPVEERKRLHAQESFPNEVWRDVIGYHGDYQVSDHGRVRSRRHGGPNWELMTPYRKKRPILYVKLRQNGDVRHVSVARLVMEAFIGTAGEDMVIIHKNHIHCDNHVHNLAYVTRGEIGKRYGKESAAKAVYKIDPVTNEILDEYFSIREAASENFMGAEAVRGTCQGERPDAFGIRFCYAADYGKVTPVPV